MTGAVVALGALVTQSQTALARDWPSQVAAVYSISFNGFEIGEFEFSSQTNRDRYAMAGKAQLSAMFGAFNWSGQTRSSGVVRRGRASPTGYNFKYESNSKTGFLDMRFGDSKVTEVSAKPRIKSGGGRVPVSDDHLRNVLDPLSAVMAMTISQSNQASVEDACDRRIPIFDGKQRFDLILAPKRRVRLDNALGEGLSRDAIVCQIRYLPVSGHRLNDETEHMMKNKDIEIWLVPVADAGLYLPYRVVLPTIAGSAILTTKRVRIDGQAGKQIAQMR